MSDTEHRTGMDRRIAAPPTMSVLAAEALRSMIMSGELLPGDRLPENSLTAQLGVSRSPLGRSTRWPAWLPPDTRYQPPAGAHPPA